VTARAARAIAQAPAPASSLVDLPAALRPAAFSWTIVPHTHWDREWYQPFEAFRWRLARMLDELLDLLESEPRFEHFTLDGQAAILDDYLGLHPHQAPRVRALLESGRLVAGPAYVLPDEFLAPQEALVRNLLIGQRVARALGAEPMAVGYQPDPFGHVAQMPQILRGFGIDSFIFWRGMGDQAERVGSLFSWRGPDGSEVLAIRQLGGYGNASQLGRWGRDGRDHGDVPEEREAVAIDRLQRYLDRWGNEVRRDAVGPLLLCNGSDHEPAWRPLPELVEAIRGAYPGIGIKVGTYADHVAGVRTAIRGRELPVVDGALREGRDAHILRGIDSIRMDLKQSNERVTQRLLAAETLASLAWLEADATYPHAALRRAWTQLLRNQPHDSISG
jgi:mannosylglycerate hydrolase